VQKVINELIQKKSKGIDNAQSAVYDDSKIRGGLTNEESTALWNLANQSVDALRNRDYATATEGSPVPLSCSVGGDQIKLGFPQYTYKDNYPNCDGESDRWTKILSGFRYLCYDYKNNCIIK
jgi:hypothetical protein